MNKQHWQDWVNVILGLWIFGSPWFVEHTMVTETPSGGVLAMWNLWLVGLAIVIVGGIAIFAFNAWLEWTNLVLGAWLLISPWVLGFSTSAALMWNAVILGILVIVCAGWALGDHFGRTQGPRHAAG